MSPEYIYSQLSLWTVIYLTHFAYNLSYIFQSGYEFVFGIRTHKGHEDGSNLDPDPQHWQKVYIVYYRNSTIKNVYQYN